MTVLDPALAQKFINKTAMHLDYNINIMNEKGIIIASKDPSRIGNFHEVAYGMLNGTINTGVVKENEKFLGTKPGVNLFIDYKNKHEGVICVSGDPKTVHVYANLVKTFMEAMLECELQVEGERKRRDKAEELIYCLFLEEKEDIASARKIASELGLYKDILRLVIIIKHDSRDYTNKIIEALVKAEGSSPQDVISVARNDDIILVKALTTKPSEAIKDYKSIMEAYIKSFYMKLPEDKEFRIIFFIGSLQTELERLKASYLHAQELALQVETKSGIYFFNDYIYDYFRSLVTIKEYDSIFMAYETLFTKEERRTIAETVQVLSKNNYNVVNSAKALKIHRNTLLFRLNKIKDVLNIDPISDYAERCLLNELAYYFSKK